MPHFEWLAVATTGPHVTTTWARVLLGVALAWVVVLGVLAILLLVR